MKDESGEPQDAQTEYELGLDPWWESVLKVPIEFGSDLFQAYSIPLLSLSERASGLC